MGIAQPVAQRAERYVGRLAIAEDLLEDLLAMTSGASCSAFDTLR
jgi:hypothetical protein